MTDDDALVERMMAAFYHGGETDARKMMRAALAVVREAEGWRRDMQAGRMHDGDVLLLLANGAVIRARYEGGLVGEDGRDAWGWQVAIEDQPHPPCWDDGICWSVNSDEEESVQPVAWMPLPPEGEG